MYQGFNWQSEDSLPLGSGVRTQWRHPFFFQLKCLHKYKRHHFTLYRTYSPTICHIYFAQIFPSMSSVKILPFLTQKRKFSWHHPPVATCRPCLPAIMALPHLPNTKSSHDTNGGFHTDCTKSHMVVFLYLKSTWNIWICSQIHPFPPQAVSKRTTAKGQSEGEREWEKMCLLTIRKLHISASLSVNIDHAVPYVLQLSFLSLLSFSEEVQKFENWMEELVQRTAFFFRRRCWWRSVRPALLLSYWFS